MHTCNAVTIGRLIVVAMRRSPPGPFVLSFLWVDYEQKYILPETVIAGQVLMFASTTASIDQSTLNCNDRLCDCKVAVVI